MKTIIRKIMNFFYVDIYRTPPTLSRNPQKRLELSIELIAEYLSTRKKTVVFIQVGANDGVLAETFLPVAAKLSWKGILLEPQKDIYEQLKENTKDYDNFMYFNVALDWKCGRRTLFKVRKGNNSYPEWVYGIASFDRNHLLKFSKLLPGLKENIIEESVECLDFVTLLDKASIGSYDVLHIDAEGYDYEILKMASISKYHPNIVKFEHINLNNKEWDESVALLMQEGYRIGHGREDTIAYLDP